MRWLNLNEEQRKELGKFFIDVAKLLLGGVVLTTVLQVAENKKVIILIIGSLLVIILVTIGLKYFKKKK